MHARKSLPLFSLCILMLGFPLFGQSPNTQGLRSLVLKEAAKSLASSDLAEAKVSNSYTTPGLNVTHVYLSQYFQGIPVEGGVINAAIRNGVVVSFNSRFIQNIEAKVSSSDPLMRTDDAMRTAALNVNMVLPGQMGTPQIEYSPSGMPIKLTYEPFHPNEEHPTVGLKWMQDANPRSKKVHLVWEVVMENPDSQSIWHVFVNAMNGEIMSKYDAVIKCFALDHDHIPGSLHASGQNTAKNNLPRILGINMPAMSASYRIFDLPVGSQLWKPYPGG